jgi:twitching motility two-component system response regulator PilG
MRKIRLRKEHEHPSRDIGTPPGGSFAQTLQTSQQVLHVQGPGHAFVMIIDDSQTVRKIVETALGREGYEVKGFPDGVEAIRWLMTPASRVPRLVILDIGLPKMNGYEIARLLKSKPQFHHTVIMMLTGRDSIVDRFKGRWAGAQTYLTKPVTTQALISAVEAHLGVPVHAET